jgi:hypothetical protein
MDNNIDGASIDSIVRKVSFIIFRWTLPLLDATTDLPLFVPDSCHTREALANRKSSGKDLLKKPNTHILVVL